MLSQIPQVSISISNSLVEKYNNINTFITQINEEAKDEKQKYIEIISNQKHGVLHKKIGDKIAIKIVEYIWNIKIEQQKKTTKRITKKKKEETNQSNTIIKEENIFDIKESLFQSENK